MVTVHYNTASGTGLTEIKRNEVLTVRRLEVRVRAHERFAAL